MAEETAQRDWLFDGRYYTVTAFSDVATRDGFGLELDDVAPAPGRGLALEAVWDDATGQFTLTAFTREALPFELVREFLEEAARRVPPDAGGRASQG